jgi:hypothetical protein
MKRLEELLGRAVIEEERRLKLLGSFDNSAQLMMANIRR